MVGMGWIGLDWMAHSDNFLVVDGLTQLSASLVTTTLTRDPVISVMFCEAAAGC